MFKRNKQRSKQNFAYVHSGMGKVVYQKINKMNTLYIDALDVHLKGLWTFKLPLIFKNLNIV